MPDNALRINLDDNVAVVTVDIKKGQRLIGTGSGEIIANTDIPRNHKVALKDIPENSPVTKYGEEIALAGAFVKAGDWVHNHNLKAREW